MLTKSLFSLFLLATIILAALVVYVFLANGTIPPNLIIFPVITAIITYKLQKKIKENKKQTTQTNIKDYTTCPFCGTHVGEAYTICSSCKAERITTLRDLFNKELKANSYIGMLGLFGLVIGFGLGLAAFGLTNNVPIAIITGATIFVIVMFGQTFIRANLLWENRKVHWYR